MKPATTDEDVRHAAREVLARRFPTAHNLISITREVNKLLTDHVDADQVNAALKFLEGVDQAKSIRDELGSTEYWSATSAGVLAFERGGN